jgi:ribokinase
MAKILVSGLINIETTVRVEGFPIPYFPVTYPFFGIKSSVAGVGYNLARALTTLGDEVAFLSLIGRDLAGEQVKASLITAGLSSHFILSQGEHTAQSVILYEPSGRREIYTDLKDIQQQVVPRERFLEAAQDCSLLALCNINFSRPLLIPARKLGKLVATDVHALARFDDDYNRDFMAAADILFLSHESLPVSPEESARQLAGRYGNPLIVIGLGSEGALLYVERDGFMGRFPAVTTRPVVNTIGAGDALFSAFIHNYARQADPYQALRSAIVFASYKIGATSAAEGFLDEPGLADWMHRTRFP